MTKLFLAAGVAALALAAPAAAGPDDRGGGKGGGNKGQAAKVERGGKSAAVRAERRGGQRFAQAERGKGQKADRQIARGAKIDRANRVDRREQRIANRIDRRDDRIVNRIDRRDDRIANRIAGRDVVRLRRLDDDGHWIVPGRGASIVGGCPPGLMDKGCIPPGQAKNLLGRVIPTSYRDSLLPLRLRNLYRDDDDFYYRYGDGYLYRVDRRDNLVSALLPLFGGGLMTGQMFPSAYSNYYVPPAYQAFYPDSSDYFYRYNNGYVYQVDRDTSLIAALIPLLTGGLGMGQMLPASYSMYNVPYQYRSFYPDTSDYYYRYAPGAIYQVDPRTSLITGVPTLLASDLSLGAPLPLGYDAYNVPLAYRANYYDTSTDWYRYNDGYIYRVDPTTRLITAVIDALV
jgi:hypothetical protein